MSLALAGNESYHHDPAYWLEIPLIGHIQTSPLSEWRQRGEGAGRMADLAEILPCAEIARYLVEDAKRICYAQFQAAATNSRRNPRRRGGGVPLVQRLLGWIFRRTSSRHCRMVSSHCTGALANAWNRSLTCCAAQTLLIGSAAACLLFGRDKI